MPNTAVAPKRQPKPTAQPDFIPDSQPDFIPDQPQAAAQPEITYPTVDSSPAQPPAKPGFFGRLAQSVGIPTSMEELKSASDPMQAIKTALEGGPIVPLIAGYAKTAYKGAKEGFSDAYQAGQDYGQGGVALKDTAGRLGYDALHTVLQATPFVGPSIDTAGQDVADKNYSGAAGGLTGVIGQIALPELFKKAAPPAPVQLTSVYDGPMPAEIPAGKPAPSGMFSKITGKIANAGNHDLVGLFSPRLAHAQKMLGKLSDITAPKPTTELPIQSASVNETRGLFEPYQGDLTVTPSAEPIPQQPEPSPAPYRMSGKQIVDAATVTPTKPFKPYGLLSSGEADPAASQPQQPSSAPYRLSGKQIIDATTVTPKKPFSPYGLLSGDTQVAPASAGQNPIPEEAAQYLKPDPAKAQVQLFKKMGVAAPSATVKPLKAVPSASLDPLPSQTFPGIEDGTDAARHQLAARGNYGINDLRAIAVQRGLKVEPGDTHVDLMNKISDSLTPQEVQKFSDAAADQNGQRTASGLPQNQPLAQNLYSAANELVKSKGNPYEITALRSAARTIEDYPQNIADVDFSKTKIPGIDVKIKKRINDFLGQQNGPEGTQPVPGAQTQTPRGAFANSSNGTISPMPAEKGAGPSPSATPQGQQAVSRINPEDIQAVRYVRYGKPPESGSSVNAMSGGAENGVSVYRQVKVEGKWMNDSSGVGFETIGMRAQGRPLYEVTGDLLPDRGSAGEPLLKNVKVVGRSNAHPETLPDSKVVLARLGPTDGLYFDRLSGEFHLVNSPVAYRLGYEPTATSLEGIRQQVGDQVYNEYFHQLKAKGIISDTTSRPQSGGISAPQPVTNSSDLTGLLEQSIDAAKAAKANGGKASLFGGQKQPFLANTETLPKYAYRVRDVGETGIRPTAAGHAEAGLDQGQVASYLTTRNPGTPQELVKIDLSQLDPSEYTLENRNGMQWVKFRTPVPESFIKKISKSSNPQ